MIIKRFYKDYYHIFSFFGLIWCRVYGEHIGDSFRNESITPFRRERKLSREQRDSGRGCPGREEKGEKKKKWVRGRRRRED